MRPEWKQTDLDCELVFDRYLGDGDLDVLEELLLDLAPTWCSKLMIWRGPRDQQPIELAQPGALRSAVIAAAGERGATYEELVERFGAGDERFSGSAELRGAGPELTVVTSVDERVVSRLGNTKRLGNTIALQVRRARVERDRGDNWLRETFEALCSRLSPAWGSAQHVAEYWAKVISEGPEIRAVGRDLGRFLPGVFWLNFFGPPYRDLLGNERLLSTPAYRVAALDDGVLVQLSANPDAWDTAEYTDAERKVRDHLGPEHFFSKQDLDRVGVAPDWGS